MHFSIFQSRQIPGGRAAIRGPTPSHLLRPNRAAPLGGNRDFWIRRFNRNPLHRDSLARGRPSCAVGRGESYGFNCPNYRSWGIAFNNRSSSDLPRVNRQ